MTISACVIAGALLGCATPIAPVVTKHQPFIGSRFIPLLTSGTLQFRDLDQDGVLAPFEDWRRDSSQRASDLVARLTLREQAGLLMHGTLAAVDNPFGASSRGYDLEAARRLLVEQHITSAITRLVVSPAEMARQNNALQEIAERARIAIPLTVSTDPRHHFDAVAGAGNAVAGFSRWPDMLGFAALRDPSVLQRFANIARMEYRATGIHQALSPQADLFTEPRWSRGLATFGSNAELARALVREYVVGFQGSEHGVTPEGVLSVVKHWVAYGAAPEGWDGHNYYGRYSRVDAASLREHARAFEGAFEVQVAGVMPTYNILRGGAVAGRTLEEVGAGFNRQLLTESLRATYGFRGIVVSDWGIVNDCTSACFAPTTQQPPDAIAMPWGVEQLSRLERVAKGINAGLDQFGGLAETELVVQAVEQGLVTVERVRESAQRVLEAKFRLGLFENPYVDPERAAALVGNADFFRSSLDTQATAQVLLQNRKGTLPLAPRARVYLRGIDPAAATMRGLEVVADVSEADIVVVRTHTPFETLHPQYFFGAMQREGRLDFRAGQPDFDFVVALPDRVRVVLAVFMDRPAILGDLDAASDAILVNFGVSDEALLDVLTGRTRARGRLPFELPASMEAVQRQHPARADDSGNPAYAYGAGIIE